MNRLNKLSVLIAFILFLGVKSVSAQTKEDLFAGTVDVTWLGLDFSQAKFIGEAAGFKDKGEVTNGDMRDRYIPGWNMLFINEPKRYDVPKYTHRAEVKYGIEGVDHANSEIKKDFFSKDPSEYGSLDAAKVEALVKKYDFKGKKGIGLMIFIDGMSKPKEEASGWAVYVNLDKKSVIMSQHVTGKPRGFGFKNYWAGAYLAMLKDCDYKDWK